MRVIYVIKPIAEHLMAILCFLELKMDKQKVVLKKMVCVKN